MVDPCSICENYINYTICDQDKCPVKKMKEENERFKKENERLQKELSDLRWHMSYMKDPYAIGDRHEMGG